MKYFLGIDPGLSEVGFGIISSKKDQMEFVDCGIIKTTPQNTFPERLSIIKKDLREILKSFQFTAVGIEELFFAKNVKTAMNVAHARGVILEEIQNTGLLIYEFTPMQIKNNICGYGGADKIQMQDMVKRLLNLDKIPKPHDAADALGAAICTEQAYKN